MSKKKRSRNSNYKNKQKEPYSTFDPKIHYRGKGQSGYGLRKDYVATPDSTSGKNLEHLFVTNEKKSKL